MIERTPAKQDEAGSELKEPQSFKISEGADLSSVGGEESKDEHEDIAGSAGGEKRREAERLKASLSHGGDDGQGADGNGKRDGQSPPASTIPNQESKERDEELEKLKIKLKALEAKKDDETKGQGGR